MITGKYPNLRLRRNRRESWTRRLVQENTLSPNDFILPIFLIDGSNKKESISTMPGVFRYTINRVSQIVDKAIKKGIPMVALFPKTKNTLKDELGSESINENNLVIKLLNIYALIDSFNKKNISLNLDFENLIISLFHRLKYD